MRTDLPPSMMCCLPSICAFLEILLPVSYDCQNVLHNVLLSPILTVSMYSLFVERLFGALGRDDMVLMSRDQVQLLDEVVVDVWELR